VSSAAQVLGDQEPFDQDAKGGVVPFPLGFPLGRPNDPAVQHSVLEHMLVLLEERTTAAPMLREYERVDPTSASLRA
jgi:hypothetical protein